VKIRIALVGFGKIARDEHLPAIRAHEGYELAAIVSPESIPEVGCPSFNNFEDMISSMPGEIDAAAICTPPTPRYQIATQAMSNGLAVLLEKPPTATLGEMEQLVAVSKRFDALLYTAWHSQHAAGVQAAREALAGEKVTGISLLWHEDVRKFHANQEWIWQPGGFGVFDPGINGLSILTRVLSEPLSVRSAELLYPGNRQAPIAARLIFDGDNRFADLDWRGTEEEEWVIKISTASGRAIELQNGGARLLLDGRQQVLPLNAEYPSIYREFAALLNARQSLVDAEPLRIVADAFLVGARKMVENFI